MYLCLLVCFAVWEESLFFWQWFTVGQLELFCRILCVKVVVMLWLLSSCEYCEFSISLSPFFPLDCGPLGAGASLPLPRWGGGSSSTDPPHHPGGSGHPGGHLSLLLHQPALRLRPPAPTQEGVGSPYEHTRCIQPTEGRVLAKMLQCKHLVDYTDLVEYNNLPAHHPTC